MYVNSYYYPNNYVELFFNNVRTGGKLYVANLLNSRQDIKNIACYRLKQSVKGKEKEAIIKFIRNEFFNLLFPPFGILNSLFTLPKDIEDILVGQMLDSCGYKKTADFYTALGFGSIGILFIGVVSAAIWVGK
jgi:hypothetical protein